MSEIINWNQELRERRKKVWNVVQKKNCDICLIYGSNDHPEYFRYLTNFVPNLGDMWAVQSTASEMTCVLNFHWELREARQVSGLQDWNGYFDPYPFLQQKLIDMKPARIAVLGITHLPWQIYTWLQDSLNVTLVPIDEEINLMRRVKSPLEVKLLREAVRVTDLAFSEARSIIKPGITELEISAEILHIFNKNGCGSAFFPLVLGGMDVDSAVIARKPRKRPLETGDTVMIDIGAEYEGYLADVGRTYVIGKPNKLQLHVWDTVQRVHEAVMRLCKPGTPCNLLHKTAEEIIKDAGYTLDHRIGHGYGLATSFEWPSLDTETEEMQPGNTFAIEPAIYKVGAGAMKIEDNIIITESGCEILSKSEIGLELS